MRDHSAAIEVPTSIIIRAAEYVCMSTDHQMYSTANQSDAIRAYAAARGMTIVRGYVDEGVSESIPIRGPKEWIVKRWHGA